MPIFGIIFGMKKIAVDKGVAFGDGGLVFIAGPCVIESREMALDLARRLSSLARKLKVGYVFKASFDTKLPSDEWDVPIKLHVRVSS